MSTVQPPQKRFHTPHTGTHAVRRYLLRREVLLYSIVALSSIDTYYIIIIRRAGGEGLKLVADRQSTSVPSHKRGGLIRLENFSLSLYNSVSLYFSTVHWYAGKSHTLQTQYMTGKAELNSFTGFCLKRNHKNKKN